LQPHPDQVHRPEDLNQVEDQADWDTIATKPSIPLEIQTPAARVMPRAVSSPIRRE
jgi:hypothetical protein